MWVIFHCIGKPELYCRFSLIIYVIHSINVYMCQSQTPNSSHHSPKADNIFLPDEEKERSLYINWNSPFLRKHPTLSLHCSPQQGRAARQHAPGLSPQLCAGWHILTDLFTSLSLSLHHLLSEERELKTASPISIGTQWGPQKCLQKKANNFNR